MLISLIIHGLVLERRGYNDKVIESGLSKASEINRNNLLEYKGKKINKRVLTYHTSLEKISGIVRHHWKENEKSETPTKLFPEPPVVAFRRPNWGILNLTKSRKSLSLYVV